MYFTQIVAIIKLKYMQTISRLTENFQYSHISSDLSVNSHLEINFIHVAKSEILSLIQSRSVIGTGGVVQYFLPQFDIYLTLWPSDIFKYTYIL